MAFYEPHLKEIGKGAADILAEEGIQIDDIPQLKQVIEDPVGYLMAHRNDPRFQTQMGFIDQILMSGE